ncbi:hypothetical protein Franean1_4547 [Parafrankia sp. EAN1pec]|uniref:SDR family oxidoreductase n=1 Tax=Parafrankia sp. (strain EAN1pec) TaxID=298653 RepID=UPI0000541688|nr:hypothetical protein Franean1_4547 [Frankia sp. EAN1pec]
MRAAPRWSRAGLARGPLGPGPAEPVVPERPDTTWNRSCGAEQYRGRFDIRVNAVSPGSVLFPDGGWERYSRRHPNEFDEFVQRDFPARRLGTVDEVADVVTFLLSERASWVNGATIAVDGAQGRPSASGY